MQHTTSTTPTDRRCCQAAVTALVATPVACGLLFAAGVSMPIVGVAAVLGVAAFGLFMRSSSCAIGESCGPFVDG